MRMRVTLTFSMCPYRDTWVISQNARAALKYISGVGADPSPPRPGPSSQANVMWPAPPRETIASVVLGARAPRPGAVGWHEWRHAAGIFAACAFAALALERLGYRLTVTVM